MMTSNLKKAVVLLSGGLDSTTILAIAKSEGYEIHALSFDYGQRHSIELTCAKEIAKTYGVRRHLIMPINLRSIGGSALTDDIAVPKDRGLKEMTTIPITYVPARNTIFLAIALGLAEVVSADTIFVGVNAIDYSGYPDCRPEFIEAFQRMANLATKYTTQDGNHLTILAPLIKMSKAEIIQRGIELGVDYSLTNSCYDPPSIGKACGRCDSCVLRLNGFTQAGHRDPISYEALAVSA
jgi:7-cyano-7-deazaguanine synthase